MEAAVKEVEDLKEQLDQLQKAAADEAARVAAAHTVQLQKLQVERTKLEVRQSICLCPVSFWMAQRQVPA